MEQKPPPICYCAGVTETKIKELIDNGISSLAGIINATGATTGCAACEFDVAKFVERELHNKEKTDSKLNPTDLFKSES